MVATSFERQFMHRNKAYYERFVVDLLSTNIERRLELKYWECSTFRDLSVRRINDTIHQLFYLLSADPTLEPYLKNNVHVAWEEALLVYNSEKANTPDMHEVHETSCPWTYDDLMARIED